MPGATATTATTAADSAMEQSPLSQILTNHLCNLCQISCEDSRGQRQHMKSPCHVHNLKRRIASLPPITVELFDAQVAQRPDEDDSSSCSEVESQHEHVYKPRRVEDVSLSRCLFCDRNYPNNYAGLVSNVAHMQTTHGFYVPQLDTITDLQTFLGYLAIEVRTWHECLYCGATKNSATAVQAHMRDKGHCQLNFDREPELREFWERQDAEGLVAGLGHADGSPNREIQPAPGTVIRSISAAQASSKASTRHPLGNTKSRAALHSSSGGGGPSPPYGNAGASSDRQLTRAQMMSLMGVSPYVHQMLATAQKKAQRSEAAAQRAREWVYARGANCQKYDQIDTKGKWGKQQHKLLPR